MSAPTAEQRLAAVEAQLAEAVAQLRQLGGAQALLMAAQAQGGHDDDDAAPVGRMRDKPWLCVNCGARLGILDAASGELRIKYKDFAVYVKRGDVRVPCRRCGRDNVLQDEPAPGA